MTYKKPCDFNVQYFGLAGAIREDIASIKAYLQAYEDQMYPHEVADLRQLLRGAINAYNQLDLLDERNFQ